MDGLIEQWSFFEGSNELHYITWTYAIPYNNDSSYIVSSLTQRNIGSSAEWNSNNKVYGKTDISITFMFGNSCEAKVEGY